MSSAISLQNLSGMKRILFGLLAQQQEAKMLDEIISQAHSRTLHK
ncbi:hypothetical protein [Pseudoalteromonas sp. SCSIO 43095]|nr:hypothetical protein [Pseudoalteromonas sp. SCSIO 43095]